MTNVNNIKSAGFSQSSKFNPFTNNNDANWTVIQRQPGYFGRKKAQIISELNLKHGDGNWRLAWQVRNKFIPLEEAITYYEEAYYQHLLKHPEIVNYLVDNASDIYDDKKTNVQSGTDYSVQESRSTHLQDIAIRRIILLRMGLDFNGNRLIQIRGGSKDPIGNSLQPGNITFHTPSLIIQPSLTGWWRKDSIEDFYQSNKVIQVRN